MFAAGDQENLAYSHQAGGIAKQHGNRHLMPKTPARRFMNENAVRPGKSVLGSRTGGKENVLTAMKGAKNKVMGTPMDTRPRAVLGDKTTNAKAKTSQPLRVKDAVKNIEKTQTRPSTSRKHKLKPSLSENMKLESVGLKQREVEDVEIAPTKVPDLPYESDVFPRGRLTFEGLKPENLFLGYYRHYYDPIDENGVSLRDQKHEQEMKLVMEKGDRKIEEEMENLDWSVPDVPSTANPATSNVRRKAPGTLASRNAAAALSMSTSSTIHQSRMLKQAPNTTLKAARGIPKSTIPIQRPSRMDSAMSIAASRTTVGYNRGRAMANRAKVIHDNNVVDDAEPTKKALAPCSTLGLSRSISTVSADSDKTITPATFSQGHDVSKRLEFLSIFNPNDEEEESDDDALQINPNHFLEEVDDEEVNIQIM
ncbi:hypothetical protein MKZ38_007023 [Zalerion maritima]|uniref:Uncharacterized protein n=1 Tax=Zalerion maritima TaxID=339359 RepID=A0AAD5WUB5_9PEZI|nr:hypothetical protein MKZ38_007023 [Zalerion maritima]